MTLEAALAACSLLLAGLGIYSFQLKIKRDAFVKNIRLKFRASTYFDDGILLDYSPSQFLSFYFDNDLIVKNTTAVYIEMENPTEIGLVKIAPYLLIRVKQKFKLPENIVYYSEPRDGIGGGGNDSIYFDGFIFEGGESINISPAYASEFGVYSFMEAQTQEEIPLKTDRDYYSIGANDAIELVLTIYSQPGIYYRFDIEAAKNLMQKVA